MARIQPGYGTKAYYINNGQWTAPIANLASVTAVVLIGGQPYMLTAGHAFRDVDNNANIMLAPQPGVNNYVGNVQAPLVLPANQPLINWGEGRLGAQAPYAASTDRYHCAGDKLGSTFDAGIAVLNAGVAWNQNYSGGKVLANIDTTWPPRALLQDEKYYLGTTEVTGLVQRDHFGVNWPTWQRQNQGGTLDRVLITDDAGRATGGVSGKALVRTIDGQQNATIIGMMLGVAKETPNGVDNKEIYQHISMAVTGFNIQGLA